MSTIHEPNARLEFQNGTLTLDRWTDEQIENVFGNKIWTWDSRSILWRAKAQDYAAIKSRFGNRMLGTEDCVPSWQPVNWQHRSLHPLRVEQQSAVEAWTMSKRGIVVMPTGTGKTEVALKILAETGCSTLVVAPIRDLMYQWQRRIQEGLGYDAGVIGDSLYHVKPISVTTYDSACIHMPRLGNQFKLIVFDECHHLPGVVRGDAARMSAAPYRLGLTATLNESDSKRRLLEEFIGPVVYELSIENVRGLTLADYEVYRITVDLNSAERARYQELSLRISEYVRKRLDEDETFKWKALTQESSMSSEARQIVVAHREKQSIEDRAEGKLRIVEDLLHLHHGTPTIIFTGSNAMARKVSTDFLLPCLLSHCGKRERSDYLDGLRDGVYPAIVANQILDEGVDVPAVKVAIVIGGMASSRQAKQRLGRVLRRSGNERAVLYEVVCQDTNEVKRSRTRRRNDAYTGTRHFKD